MLEMDILSLKAQLSDIRDATLKSEACGKLVGHVRESENDDEFVVPDTDREKNPYHTETGGRGCACSVQ